MTDINPAARQNEVFELPLKTENSPVVQDQSGTVAMFYDAAMAAAAVRAINTHDAHVQGLILAARWFEQYGDGHMHKGDQRKAERNYRRAMACRMALHGGRITEADGEPDEERVMPTENGWPKVDAEPRPGETLVAYSKPIVPSAPALRCRQCGEPPGLHHLNACALARFHGGIVIGAQCVTADQLCRGCGAAVDTSHVKGCALGNPNVLVVAEDCIP